MPRRGDFTTDPRQLAILAGLAVILGVAATGLAFVLLGLIAFFTNLAYRGQLSFAPATPTLAHWGLASALVPILGGLVVGVVARYGSDKIRGHGIPEALQAILENESLIPARLLALKPIASAIAIGTGGPFGAEGPIIMSGGTLGSVVAQYLHLAPIERRVLLVSGAAAGMSATFGSPVAAVFLAVELLLFEWRPRSLIPVAIASVVAYAGRSVLFGTAAIFPVHALHAVAPGQLAWALALGLAVGGVSGLLTIAVYGVEDLYHRLPIHWMWWPALGGVAIGLGGLVAPQALGVGYPTIGAFVDGRVALASVGAIVGVKAVIWAIALSSGTSGGVLAPLLMIGGGLGALASGVIPGHDEGLWATVAMAAMLGGTMRAPFTATVFALETTHDWTLMVASFVCAIAATAVTVVFVPRSILTERLARRGIHVAREYAIHPLERATVGAIARPRDPHAALPDDAILIDDRASVRVAVDTMARRRTGILAVVDDAGKWVGILEPGDVLEAWRRGVDEEEARRRVRSVPIWGFRGPGEAASGP